MFQIIVMYIITSLLMIFSPFLTDLTRPTVELLSVPSSLTNQPTGSFRFRCVNEYRCTYVCAVHVAGSNPTYAPCSGSWSVSNLRGGVDYVFSVIPTDAVGNVGAVETYTWRIGKAQSRFAETLKSENDSSSPMPSS